MLLAPKPYQNPSRYNNKNKSALSSHPKTSAKVFYFGDGRITVLTKSFTLYDFKLSKESEGGFVLIEIV